MEQKRLHVPALCMPNADCGALAHLVSLGLLDKVMHALSGSADASHGQVDPRVKTIVLEGKFADPLKAKDKGCPEHQTVVSFEGGCL